MFVGMSTPPPVPKMHLRIRVVAINLEKQHVCKKTMIIIRIMTMSPVRVRQTASIREALGVPISQVIPTDTAVI